MILGDLQLFNEAEFKRKSRQLDLLARGDFTPIREELSKAYPNTDLPIRAIPFVMRYVAELSGLYQRPVVRRFKGTSIAAETWQTLQAVYDASKLDVVLSQAEQALWTQNTVLLLVMPDRLGRVRVHQILPWQIELIEMDEPLAAADPASWTKIWLQVPVQVVNNTVIFGRMELTRTEAWRYKGADRIGIYQNNGGHPFGKVPLVVTHRVKPDDGRPCAPVNEAVLNLQIAISLQAADNELIIRHCAWPQKVIEGGDTKQAVETMTLGPDTVYNLTRTGDPNSPSPKMSVVQGQVPVTELVNFAEHQVRMYCAMLGLDPSTFIRVNTSVTAAARLFSAQDRAAQRDKILPVLDQLETDVMAMIVAVMQLGQPFPVPADLSVESAYQFYEPSADPLRDAQALALNIKMGMTSSADALAKEKGISRPAALAQVEQNIGESRDLGVLADIVVGAAAAVAEGAGTATPAGDTGAEAGTGAADGAGGNGAG